jgi:hypothetical protein
MAIIPLFHSFMAFIVNVIRFFSHWLAPECCPMDTVLRTICRAQPDPEAQFPADKRFLQAFRAFTAF